MNEIKKTELINPFAKNTPFAADPKRIKRCTNCIHIHKYKCKLFPAMEDMQACYRHKLDPSFNSNL